MSRASISSRHVVIIFHSLCNSPLAVDLRRINTSPDCLRSIDRFHLLVSFSSWPDESFHCREAAYSVALTAIFSRVWVVHRNRVQEQILDKPFIADVTVGSVPVLLPVFLPHNQRPFVCHVFSHFPFMILRPYQKYKNCVFTSVCERAKRRNIAPHNHVRKPAWLMLLCFHCKALARGCLSFSARTQNQHKPHRAPSSACDSL